MYISMQVVVYTLQLFYKHLLFTNELKYFQK